MPVVQPNRYHTVDSLRASNALRGEIRAGAKRAIGGTAENARMALKTVVVRNASWGEPAQPATSPGNHAKPHAAAAPRPGSLIPCNSPSRRPLGNDSWLRFVHHLQDNGRVPGAMQDDPERGVVYSTNVSPRAVASFLRQTGQSPAASPAVDGRAASPPLRPLSLQIKPVSLVSCPSDEGIGLASPTLSPQRTPADVIAPAGSLPSGRSDEEGASNSACSVSEDEGHVTSDSSSPAGSSGSDSWGWDDFEISGNSWGGQLLKRDGAGSDPEARLPTTRHDAACLDSPKSSVTLITDWLFKSNSESESESESDDMAEAGNDPWEPQPIAPLCTSKNLSVQKWLDLASEPEASGELGKEPIMWSFEDDEPDAGFLGTIHEEDMDSVERFST